LTVPNLFDLGRVDRALSLFVSSGLSAISLGTYSLLAALLCTVGFTENSDVNAPTTPAFLFTIYPKGGTSGKPAIEVIYGMTRVDGLVTTADGTNVVLADSRRQMSEIKVPQPRGCAHGKILI
jgi:hypothetical protein